jgi:hypothetical protein
MSATDYSVGLTVRIAIPLKLNPELQLRDPVMLAGPLSRAFQRLSALAADTSTGGEQHRANT